MFTGCKQRLRGGREGSWEREGRGGEEPDFIEIQVMCYRNTQGDFSDAAR